MIVIVIEVVKVEERGLVTDRVCVLCASVTEDTVRYGAVYCGRCINNVRQKLAWQRCLHEVCRLSFSSSPTRRPSGARLSQ